MGHFLACLIFLIISKSMGPCGLIKSWVWGIAGHSVMDRKEEKFKLAEEEVGKRDVLVHHSFFCSRFLGFFFWCSKSKT